MTAEHWATSACAITPLASALSHSSRRSSPVRVRWYRRLGQVHLPGRCGESQKKGCAMEDEPLYFSKRSRRSAACGSRRVVRIVYGYPSPDLMQDAESGKGRLGRLLHIGFRRVVAVPGV